MHASLAWESCVGKWPVLTLLVTALSGCGSMPSSGPTVSAIEGAKQSGESPDGVDLIDLTPTMVARIADRDEAPLSGHFADHRPSPVQTVGIGDTVAVTIYEAGAGGLFSSVPGEFGTGTKSASLPAQFVSADGHITVPYAGRIRVAGLTTDKVERAIVEKLRDRAIEPQAVVSITAARSSLVTVNGEVGAPGRIALSPKGDRLLDVLASAGGTKGPVNDLFVRMTRNGATGSVPIRTVLEDPVQNVWAWPGDQVFVYREPQSFTALGATGRAGTFSFEYSRLNLAEAIGTASGLNDLRAEPAGVFVYRLESPVVICAIKAERNCISSGPARPVVYRLNLRDPNGLALAQRIPVRNKDVVYVANAEMAEVAKVLGLFATVASAANSVSATEARLR